MHQRKDFPFGTLPVFRRKSIEREIFDFQFTAGLHAFTNGLRSRFVAFDAWETTRFGPATVTIHNNGDVKRNGIRRREHDYRIIGSPRSGLALSRDDFPPGRL